MAQSFEHTLCSIFCQTGSPATCTLSHAKPEAEQSAKNQVAVLSHGGTRDYVYEKRGTSLRLRVL